MTFDFLSILSHFISSFWIITKKPRRRKKKRRVAQCWTEWRNTKRWLSPRRTSWESDSQWECERPRVAFGLLARLQQLLAHNLKTLYHWATSPFGPPRFELGTFSSASITPALVMLIRHGSTLISRVEIWLYGIRDSGLFEVGRRSAKTSRKKEFSSEKVKIFRLSKLRKNYPNFTI